MAKKIFKNPGKIVRDDSGKPILDKNGNYVYSPQSGAANVTMAPWEYLMALPENAVGDAVFGLASKVASPFIKKAASKAIPKIISKIETPKFTSDINWGKWNKEILDNPKLLNEYHAIEESAKKAGSWMKNSDGSKFTGTPEQFIQQQSINYRKAFPEGSDLTYRGDSYHFPELRPNTHGYKGHAIFSANRELAEKYGSKDLYNSFSENSEEIAKQKLNDYRNLMLSKGRDKSKLEMEISNTNPYNTYYIKTPKQKGIHELYSPKSNNQIIVDANGANWGEIRDRNLNKILGKSDNAHTSTDDIAQYIKKNNINNAIINNVNDGGIGNEIITNIKPGNYLKSARGNNGMFDMTNPNIYKGITGAALINQTLNNNDMKKQYKSGGRLSRSFGFNSPDYSTGGNLYFLGGNTDKKTNQGVNVSGLVDMAIPGAGAAMSLVNSAGDSVGGGLGAAMKGSVNPFAATFNKNLKPWQRALGTINPALGGLMAYNEQQKEDNFNSGVADMRQRNEMLGIKANGGSLRSYEVSDAKPFTSWYDSQPFYTEALQNKYKDLPTKEIIANATNDKSFRNSKLNQYNDSLISKYGDKYLTSNEVDSVARRNNIPNIFDLDKQVKSSDYNGAGEINNTMGSKENTLNKYGYRMMLNRSFPKGSNPYKAAGGYILPSGVSSNMATEYAQGGMLTEFGAGGSHESSPTQGVQQGISNDGTPNRVEEGETKYQDYIFSDRLKIDKQAVEEHNMPKSMINKTFADASKRISKLHKERPNDPITRDTMKSKMDHLMMANDEIREYEQSSMMAMGGHLYDGLSEDTGFLNLEDPRILDRYLNQSNMSKINSIGLDSSKPQSFGLEKDKLNAKVANIAVGTPESKTNLGGTGNVGGFLKDPKNLRYAPIAFDALAATGLFGKSPKSEQYSPTLIKQQGNLSAPQVNEESMRAKIDAAYQNQIRGMAGASGGSGVALRSGLTGVGEDYMSAVGQGFLGAETANNQAKMQTDQYNLGAAQNVASQNAQMQNQAGLYNNQIINQNNALNYDNKMSYLGKGAEGLGDIGYEARNAEILPRLFGYNQYGEYKPLNAKACGGRLRMMNRKKK